MYLTKAEYDRGVNTFNPDGRIFQVEYAMKAMEQGSTAIGIETSEGVVLAVEKNVQSSLMIPKSLEKIMEVDAHIGVAMSGIISDARSLIDHARLEAQNHRFTYDEPMCTESLVQAVCDLALSFGEGKSEDEDTKKMMSRPFGVGLLLGGIDNGTPGLYFTDPSGNFSKYKAKAIGQGADGAQQNLEESYSDSMTLVEAEDLAVTVLRQVMEGNVDENNVEVVAITPADGYRPYGGDAVRAIVDRTHPAPP